MLLLKCMFLCLCISIMGSSASSDTSSFKLDFIDKCKWNDTACLLTSSQKAIPSFANGIPSIGLQPLDPMKIDSALFNEGGLKFDFRDMTVTGASKCRMINVERNLDESYIFIEAECPITVQGDYTASGHLLSTPIEGNDLFEVTNKIRISAKIRQSIDDGADGQKHWKLGKAEYKFDVIGKAHISVKNLFNGDEEKAAPFAAIIEDNGKELVKTIGKPIFNEVMKKIISSMKILTKYAPANELEL